MALLIPEGFAQVTIPFHHSGLARDAVITYGAVSPDGNPAEADAHLEAFSGNITMDSEVTMGPVRLSVGTGSGEHLAVEGTTDSIGTSSGARLPANSALLVRKLTSRGGRRGRGRVFIPWRLEEGQVDELGLIGSVQLAAMQSELDAWYDDLVSRDIEMVLLHSTGESTPGAPNAVTSLSAVALIGTQRRRLGR